MQDSSITILNGMHTPVCQATVDKHFVGYHTLQLMTEGGVWLAYDDEHYLLEGAWLWPAMPGPHIRFHTAPGYTSWNHRYIAFTGARIEAWGEAGLLLTHPKRVPSNADYAHLFDQLYGLMTRNDLLGQSRAVNHLERILLLIADSDQDDAPDPPWLAETCQALGDACLDMEVDYDDIAASVNMAYSTLRRRFHVAKGISLHQYVIQQRIARGRRLLIESDLPIKAVAAKLGYRDIHYFSRQFKQTAGISPAQFRLTRQG